MKHIIIEGGDRLGKSTLIESISKHFNFDNVSVRHFGKPPKTFEEGESPLDFQARCFVKEGAMLEFLKQNENDKYGYFENVVIWNRAHLGEYVYGQMFRGEDPKEIKDFLLDFEEQFLLENLETYLILLTADPEFFLSKEDGNSFSQNLDQKTTELRLFDEIFEASSIDKKLRVNVSMDGKFLPKEYVFNKVMHWIKYDFDLL